MISARPRAPYPAGKAIMAQRISRLKKTIVIAAAVALTIGGAGVAVAYWTSGGTGDGTATTEESVAFEITADPAVGALVPGGDGETVEFTVTNPGPATQYLTSITVTLADAAGAAWVPPTGCLISDYTATISASPTIGSIAAGDFVTGTATVVLANRGANQDACQGAEVPLHFVAA